MPGVVLVAHQVTATPCHLGDVLNQRPRYGAHCSAHAPRAC